MCPDMCYYLWITLFNESDMEGINQNSMDGWIYGVIWTTSKENSQVGEVSVTAGL